MIVKIKKYKKYLKTAKNWYYLGVREKIPDLIWYYLGILKTY